MRNWEEVDCPNAHECFNGGHWGKGAYDDEESSRAGGKPWGICCCMTEQEHAEAQEELEDAMKTDCIPLSVESLADALQDSVHKECGGARAAVSGRPPCNPMATQCPRCNNSVAECDALAGRDTDHDWKFDYCHPHNGEYWYKCVNCGASDWISRADHLSGQLLLLKVGETCKAKDVSRKKKMTPTWQREAVGWLRGKAAEQAQNNERWPEHAKCYPSWTERVETAQRLADELEREAEEEST